MAKTTNLFLLTFMSLMDSLCSLFRYAYKEHKWESGTNPERARRCVWGRKPKVATADVKTGGKAWQVG